MEETCLTQYDEGGEITMIAIYNQRKKIVEFLKTSSIKMEDAKNLMKITK